MNKDDGSHLDIRNLVDVQPLSDENSHNFKFSTLHETSEQKAERLKYWQRCHFFGDGYGWKREVAIYDYDLLAHDVKPSTWLELTDDERDRIVKLILTKREVEAEERRKRPINVRFNRFLSPVIKKKDID